MKYPEVIKDIGRVIINIPGFHTKRKIVVIESDDWGSIRTPSKEVLDSLIKKGIRVDRLPYNRYDSLASEEDLTALFEVLSSVKDKNGNPAVITANAIMTNPDFDKIRDSNFKEYFFELFTETLKRYPKHTKSFNLWIEGIRSGLFKPQFHGREHINVNSWMSALRNNYGKARIGFNYKMYDLRVSLKPPEISFLETFNLNSSDELDFQKKAIVEGCKIFEEIFGYQSETFIAPCFVWSRKLNRTLKDCGISGFQGVWTQFDPQLAGNKRKRIIHYTGQKNKLNQTYLVRNVFFEPSLQHNYDSVNEALYRIRLAFIYGKPAIISSHRLNFIGFIDPKNRERNLRMFSILLKEVVKKWPTVEFMSSDQLVELIRKK